MSLLVDQWVPEGTCSQVLRSTSVYSSRLRASKFPVIKLTEIAILWVYYTIPFGFSLIWHILGITFQLLNYFVWLRITDEGSVPEMRIWSILLIKSDLKWCIHLSRSLFLYYCITACGGFCTSVSIRTASLKWFNNALFIAQLLWKEIA